MSLSGKVCVVTGASRGIGRACAEALSAQGARLALCASQSVPALPSASEGYAARCDVSDSRSVASFLLET